MRVLGRGLSITEAFQEGAFVPGVAVTKAAQRLAINGETKSVLEWANDPRCKVDVTTIWYRLKNGWPHAAAVLSPPHAPPPRQCRRTRGRPSLVVEAWGEKKTLAQWARDPRARVRTDVMKSRLDQGYTPEEAISLPRWQRLRRQAT